MMKGSADDVSDGGSASGQGLDVVCAGVVAGKFCEVSMLLRQMRLPSVRGDFLAGRVLKCDDPEAMLVLLDGLYNTFVPVWNSDPCVRAVAADTAGKHFKLLLEESPDVFEVPCDYVIKGKHKYSTWMQALNKLLSCPYWITQGGTSDNLAAPAIFDDVDAGTGDTDKLRKRPKEDDRGLLPEKRQLKGRVHYEGTSSAVRSGRSGSDDQSDRGRSLAKCRSPVESENSCSDSGERATRRRPHLRSKASNRSHHYSVIEIDDTSEDSTTEGGESSEFEQYERRGRSKYFQKDVVAPEVFSVEGETSLKTFLSDFERYFSIKFAGNQRDRCRELGRFLEGEVRDAYDAVGGPLLKYSGMKRELLQWHKSQQVGRIYKRKAELKQTRMKEGESFKLYCMRLEKLAFRAYPHDDQEGAKQLSRHLLSTVPNWFARNVEKRRETKKIMKPNAKVTWEDIVYIAELEDKKKKKKDLMRKDVDAEEPYVAHVAATQHMVAPKSALLRSPRVPTPQNGRNGAGATRSAPPPPRQSNQTVPNSARPPPPQHSSRTGNGVARSPPFQQTYRNSSSYSGYKCFNCGGTGHFASHCRERKEFKCFCCGEVGHHFRDCSQYINSSQTRREESSPLLRREVGSSSAVISEPSGQVGRQVGTGSGRPDRSSGGNGRYRGEADTEGACGGVEDEESRVPKLSSANSEALGRLATDRREPLSYDMSDLGN